jgi:predicted RNA polymerase sigma factor
VIDRVGQTWNFPMRCEDGIHLVTAVVVESLGKNDEGTGETHRMLFLESSSQHELRQSGAIVLVAEHGWKPWDEMSSWTRLG